MATSDYSFIDIAALDGVRERFAGGEALAILSDDLSEVIWANGPGARIFGHGDIESAMGAPSGLAFAQRRQIAATPGFPAIGRDRPLMLRLASGSGSRAAAFLASSIELPGGETALLLAQPSPLAHAREARQSAALAVSGFGESGFHAALLSADGAVLAAGDGFAAVGIPADEIRTLLAEASDSPTRVVKRMAAAVRGNIPAGVARLTDSPALHLVVVVDDPSYWEADGDDDDLAPDAAEDVTAHDDASPAVVTASGIVGTGIEEPATAADAPARIAVPDEMQVRADAAPQQEPGELAPSLAAVPEESGQSVSEPGSEPAATDALNDPLHDESDGERADEPAPDVAAFVEEAAAEADTESDAAAGQATADNLGQAVDALPDESDAAGVDDTGSTDDAHLEDPAMDPLEAEHASFADEAPSEPADDLDPGSDEGFVDVDEPAPPAAAASSGSEGRNGQLDTWYFATDGASAGRERGAVAGSSQLPGAPARATEPPPAEAIERRTSGAVRFAWRTDADGRFRSISPDIGQALGAETTDVLGSTFGEVSDRLGLDPDHVIAGLLERRDTWSGKMVLWPIAGTDLAAPVDLAALPIYDRDRNFEGFRGFGIVRLDDTVVDPAARGLRAAADAVEMLPPTATSEGDAPHVIEEASLELVRDRALADDDGEMATDGDIAPLEHETGQTPEPDGLVTSGVDAAKAPEGVAGDDRASTDHDGAAQVGDPFRGEAPIISIETALKRRHADKIIRLAEHRQPNNERSLSSGERNAFREIGERLKEVVTTRPQFPQAPDTARPAAPVFGRKGLTPPPATDETATSSSASQPETAEAADNDRPHDARQDASPPETAVADGEPETGFGFVATPADVEVDDRVAEAAALAAPEQSFPAEDTASAAKDSPVADMVDTADSGHSDTEANDAAAVELGYDPDAAAEPEGVITAAADAGGLADPSASEAPPPGPAQDDDTAGPSGDPDFPAADETPAVTVAAATDAYVADSDAAGTEPGSHDAPGYDALPQDAEPVEATLPDVSDAPEKIGDDASDDNAVVHLRGPARHLGVSFDDEPDTTHAIAADQNAAQSAEPADFQVAGLAAPAEAAEIPSHPADDQPSPLPHTVDTPPAAGDQAGEEPEASAPDAVVISLGAPNRAEAEAGRSTAVDQAGSLLDIADVEGGNEPVTTENDLSFEDLDGAPAMPERVETHEALLTRLPLPMLIHAGDTLHFANDAFLAFSGYASLEALRQGGGLGALFADPDLGTPDAPAGAVLRTAEGREIPVRAHLQSTRWYGRSALLLAVSPSSPVQPERSEPQQSGVEADLRASVEEMRTILDTATDGVVILGDDGTIRSINTSAEALFGYDTAEVAGKPFSFLFAVESQRAARDYLTGLSENGVASVLNDGREVIGREVQGRFIPLFMTIGRLPGRGGFCAVMRDITQWKRAEEELTQARTLAERASSQKTEFLARVSHEIRTPLNAIIGFSELMLDERFGPVGSERYRDYLRDINRSGNHVLDLVNDLLDISKIEAGEQEMNYEAVALNDALTEAVAMMQPQANRERVIIRSSFASRLPDVVADLRSVRQIALNLLSNAIRFTQPGGQVIVSTAYERTGDVVMRVRDTGVGMSSAEIDQALKPFKQVHSLKRSRVDGTGLGLPLTKAMVEANRARFTINSAPGEGTMVEISFPSTRVLAD